MEGARVLGIVERDSGQPRVAYVAGAVPVTPEVTEATGPVPPTHVMRFAAPCVESSCTHFDGTRCKLAARVAEGLAPVVRHLPPCAIRRTCRWHAQEGRAACLRCPQVVTRIEDADLRMREVAGVG